MQDYSTSFHSFSHSILLLTDLTSAPDDKSTGIENCQKMWKSIADTHIDTAYE